MYSKTLTIIGRFLIVFLIAFGIFYTWNSKVTYMDVITDREWNDPGLDTKLLIASQGSEYKNALVEAVVSQLYSDSIYISLTDVTKLPLVIESDWSAVLVIHTFQKWRAQRDAQSYIESNNDLQNIIVVATSGSGEEMLPGVDGITAVSQLSDIDSHSKEIIFRLQKHLK